MTKFSQKHFLAGGILLALVILLADQWSKIAVLAYFENRPYYHVKITPFFNMVLVWNKGISFGLFNNNAYSPLIFTLIAAIIVVILLAWLKKADNLLQALSLGAVIGGAVGNVIDRVRFGAVVDFLDFYVENYHWPAFNIADSAICIGVILLTIDSIFSGKKLPEAKAPHTIH
jgi:signal peptidase II